MERIINSGTLRIAFDFVVGMVLLVLAATFFSTRYDMAVTALSAVIVVIGTGLFIRQDYEIIKAYKAERV